MQSVPTASRPTEFAFASVFASPQLLSSSSHREWTGTGAVHAKHAGTTDAGAYQADYGDEDPSLDDGSMFYHAVNDDQQSSAAKPSSFLKHIHRKVRSPVSSTRSLSPVSPAPPLDLLSSGHEIPSSHQLQVYSAAGAAAAHARTRSYSVQEPSGMIDAAAARTIMTPSPARSGASLQQPQPILKRRAQSVLHTGGAAHAPQSAGSGSAAVTGTGRGSIFSFQQDSHQQQLQHSRLFSGMMLDRPSSAPQQQPQQGQHTSSLVAPVPSPLPRRVSKVSFSPSTQSTPTNANTNAGARVASISSSGLQHSGFDSRDVLSPRSTVQQSAASASSTGWLDVNRPTQSTQMKLTALAHHQHQQQQQQQHGRPNSAPAGSPRQRHVRSQSVPDHGYRASPRASTMTGHAQPVLNTADNFKVMVRVRPPLPREVDAYLDTIATYAPASLRDKPPPFPSAVQVDPMGNELTIREYFGPLGSIGSGAGAQPVLVGEHRMTFDRVFDQQTSQAAVYQHCAQQAVQSTLEGYNATLIAYGQTGSGKTFTMEGLNPNSHVRVNVNAVNAAPAEDGELLGYSSRDEQFDLETVAEMRGIIPRSVEDIFDHIDRTASSTSRYLVRAAYLQIYNEVISDLLKPERGSLAVREDKNRRPYVEGLSEWVVTEPAEVYALIRQGSAARATSATKLNDVSSRSHAIFVIIVEQQHVQQDPDTGASREVFTVAKLNFVDLAGSERVRVSGASGQRLEESKKINQSLSALGNVIASLTSGSASTTGGAGATAAAGLKHVPYRDSKLTRILEDSLGGNTKTTMLATISPAPEAFSESLSTLKFASRAKSIKNQARINESMDDKSLLSRYEKELKQLRSELAQRSQSVVDKRQLIEAEEERKRAEQDRMQALSKMEQLSEELSQEKVEKRKLEARIQQLTSQLLVGRSTQVSVDSHSVAGQPAGSALRGTSSSLDLPMLKQALAQDHERIRREYNQRLEELERERLAINEEKVQVDQFKQLLLKQREVMLQLSARLNERDESILTLTDELQQYDWQQRVMEEKLDAKTASLIHLQKLAASTTSPLITMMSAAPQAAEAASTFATAAQPSHSSPSDAGRADADVRTTSGPSGAPFASVFAGASLPLSAWSSDAAAAVPKQPQAAAPVNIAPQQSQSTPSLQKSRLLSDEAFVTSIHVPSPFSDRTVAVGSRVPTAVHVEPKESSAGASSDKLKDTLSAADIIFGAAMSGTSAVRTAPALGTGHDQVPHMRAAPAHVQLTAYPVKTARMRAPSPPRPIAAAPFVFASDPQLSRVWSGKQTQTQTVSASPASIK